MFDTVSVAEIHYLSATASKHHGEPSIDRCGPRYAADAIMVSVSRGFRGAGPNGIHAPVHFRIWSRGRRLAFWSASTRWPDNRAWVSRRHEIPRLYFAPRWRKIPNWFSARWRKIPPRRSNASLWRSIGFRISVFRAKPNKHLSEAQVKHARLAVDRDVDVGRGKRARDRGVVGLGHDESLRIGVSRRRGEGLRRPAPAAGGPNLIRIGAVIRLSPYYPPSRHGRKTPDGVRAQK